MVAKFVVAALLLLRAADALRCLCSGSYPGFVNQTIAKIEQDITTIKTTIEWLEKSSGKFENTKLGQNMKDERAKLAKMQALLREATILNTTCAGGVCTARQDSDCFGYEFGHAQLLATNGQFQKLANFKINTQHVQELVLGCGSHGLLAHGIGVVRGPGNTEPERRAAGNCHAFYRPFASGGWRNDQTMYSCKGDLYCEEDFAFRRYYTCQQDVCNDELVEGKCQMF